jgi:cytochrome c
MIRRRPSLAVVAVLAGFGAAHSAAAQDAAAGSAVFQGACAVCHGLDGHAGTGPSLGGVVGRKAGAVPGFSYSAAMKAYGQTWTPAKLDAFIAAPSKTVPGTQMSFFGMKDPARRADLIAFLRAKR